MKFLDHVRPRLILVGRVIMWAAISLFGVIGLLQSAPAWAQPTICSGNSSIPIAPLEIFLRYGGPAITYEVSLCEDPSAPVDVTTSVEPTDLVTVSPTEFTLNSTISQTVSVSITAGHPADDPFTVTITHSATSEDPNFDYGSVNVPIVTAYYSPPMAVDDLAAPLFGQSVTIDALANDVDRRGLGLTLPVDAIVTGPAHGTATINVTQTLQYTPAAGYAGPDSFTYSVEDAEGNRDFATVVISVAAENVENPQIEEVEPEQGGQVEFESSLGNVQVEVPALEGVSDDSTVAIVFGQTETPIADEEDAPIPGGTFSGLVFKLELLIDGVPVTPGVLSEPLRIALPLPDSFVDDLNGARVIIAVWDGTSWVTEGVTVEGLGEILAQLANTPGALNATNITINTTVFGEFLIFTQQVLFMPLLED